MIERARDIPAEHSRHMLELAATYERTADSLAPAPATSEAHSVFRPPQPIEHNLAKVGVEGSNPFARSNNSFKLQRYCLLGLVQQARRCKPEAYRKQPE